MYLQITANEQIICSLRNKRLAVDEKQLSICVRREEAWPYERQGFRMSPGLDPLPTFDK
jgi:hypothetical protein